MLFALQGMGGGGAGLSKNTSWKGSKGGKKAFSFMGSLHFSCLMSRALMKGGKGLCGYPEKNIPSRRDSKNKSLKAAAALLRKTVAASGVANGAGPEKARWELSELRSKM